MFGVVASLLIVRLSFYLLLFWSWGCSKCPLPKDLPYGLIGTILPSCHSLFWGINYWIFNLHPLFMPMNFSHLFQIPPATILLYHHFYLSHHSKTLKLPQNGTTSISATHWLLLLCTTPKRLVKMFWFYTPSMSKLLTPFHSAPTWKKYHSNFVILRRQSI